MPRTDDRYQGRAYRHGYMIVYRGQDGSSATGHLDFATGELEVYNPGPGDTVQECQFVPRTPDSPEGDGWLAGPGGAGVEGAERSGGAGRAEPGGGTGRDDQAAGAGALDLPRLLGAGGDAEERAL